MEKVPFGRDTSFAITNSALDNGLRVHPHKWTTLYPTTLLLI